MSSTAMSWPGLFSRWAYGVGLVTWRYLWQTMPLHRSERWEEDGHHPPELAAGVHRDGLLLPEDGAGSVFHRVFRVRIADATLDSSDLMRGVIEDIGGFVPREVVRIKDNPATERGLAPNDDFVVDMPGPWNGPVRVVLVEERRLRLATMEGHLEAGQIEFRAYEEDDHVVFEIEAWARPSSALVDLLYSRLRLAKEVQLNMWVRFCRTAATRAGGRPLDGVSIVTFEAPGT